MKRSNNRLNFSLSIFIICMLETFGWIYLPVNATFLPSSREFLSRSNIIRAGIPPQSVIEQALQQVKNNEHMDLDLIREAYQEIEELSEVQEREQLAPSTLHPTRSAAHPPKGRKEFAIMKDLNDANPEAASFPSLSSSVALSSSSFRFSKSLSGKENGEKPLPLPTLPHPTQPSSSLSSFFPSVILSLSSFLSLPGIFSGAKDIFDVLLTSIAAILQILTVCSIGTLLSFKGILDNKTSSTLGNMVFNVLLPCLLFTDMALTINIKQIYSFISVALYAVLYPIIGFGLGKIVKFFCSPPEEIERGIIMSICFGNAAFLPLTLIATVAASSVGIFAEPNAQQTAIQYISIYVSAFSLVYWTVAPHYMSAPLSSSLPLPSSSDQLLCSSDDVEKEDEKLEGKEEVYDGVLENLSTSPTECSLFLPTAMTSSPTSTSSSDLPTETLINMSMIDLDLSDKEVHSLAIPQKISDWVISTSKRSKEGVVGFLKKFLSPPTIAVIFGLLVGLILPLKHLLFSLPNEEKEEEEGYVFVPLEFITNAMMMVGAAALPCSMIVLGVNLSSGPTRDKINKRTIFGVTTARLFLLPLIGMGITLLLSKYHLLPDDPVLKFILMLEGATPSAMSLVIICQKNGYGEKDMATLQFWVYISSALSLTIFVSLFMYILQ